MSRWTSEDVKAVLAAADAWRARCLGGDGSVFTSNALWTLPNLTDFQKRFVGNPIEGTKLDFYQKLERQLAWAPKETTQLAAEVVWFMLLFPHQSKFGAEKKRQKVQLVWSWSGES